MTRLSKIHPYPAMIADHLAVNLASKYVSRSSRVLDPFCGTGRTLLAAAEQGAYCVGIDVNPLASMIVNAKASNVKLTRINNLLHSVGKIATKKNATVVFDFESNRIVSWFSSKIKKELSSLIIWINNEDLNRSEMVLVSSVLSATVRDVSYCRKDQWKLHRMNEKDRDNFYKSPILTFKNRLQNVYDELCNAPQLKGNCYSILGDAKNLSHVLRMHNEIEKFDLVITSPPYGDSKTTVQYGAMSGLSLGVLRHLKNISIPVTEGYHIDKACLGADSSRSDSKRLIIKKYWQGGTENPAYYRVNSFLSDLGNCCMEINSVVKRRCRVVFVVARRSTGGWRVYLDNFLIDTMRRNNFSLEQYTKRNIDNKLTPFLISRLGKKTSKSSKKDHIKTMRSEYILVFKRS